MRFSAAVARTALRSSVRQPTTRSERTMAKRERFAPERRRDIFDRTRGKCHICHKQLSFANYGASGARGAWHVEHSVALANGGTNHGNNLYAACIWCNIEKCTANSRTARSWAGKQRAPLSMEKAKEARTQSALGGGLVGAAVGAAIAGPAGLILFSLFGAAVGHEIDPDK
jgi:5-methylcytosine-specific restriction endonuclease McrA